VTETDAEVVHVVSAEEARARSTSPGAGLAFTASGNLFSRAIEAFLSACPERKPRVLVADDDALLREMLRDVLTEAGFEVELAADGNEVLERFSARLFDLDLLLLDLLMPGLDGVAVIERVRSFSAELDLRIVVLSGAPRAELERLRSKSVDAVIAKGTPLEEIVGRLLALVRR